MIQYSFKFGCPLPTPGLKSGADGSSRKRTFCPLGARPVIWWNFSVAEGRYTQRCTSCRPFNMGLKQNEV